MCRHLAWLGAPQTVEELLYAPEHGLLRQSYAPRRQVHGTMNADGFGLGWYHPARPEPARYRRSGPIWADASLASMAGVLRSGCVLAAVRSATAGTPPDESACAPFLLPGGVLLSHNGRVRIEAVAHLVDAGALAAVGSTVDSAYVAAVVASRLDAGLAGALASTVQDVGRLDPQARLNLLATDGRETVAITWGDTLWSRTSAGGTLLASEPGDEDPAWSEVPDRTLVRLRPEARPDAPLTLEDL